MAKANKGSVAVAAPKGNKASAPVAAKADKASKAFTPMKVLETVQVNPSELVMREQKLRGRSKDISQEELYSLADSLVKQGQQQPIQVRKNKEGKLETLFGNTRTLAGRMIQQGFKFTVNGKEVEHPPVPDFTLRAEVVECDDDDAFLRTAIENAQRFQTSSIDDAINHETLRNDYGMSDAAITRLYGYGHQASVTQLKKLLALPQDLQDRIHRGDMTKQAGFMLVDWCRKKGFINPDTSKLDQTVCDEVMKEVKGGEDIGNVGSTEIANCIKAYEKSQSAPVATPEGGTTGETGGDTGTTTGETGGTTGETGTPATSFPVTLKEFKDTLGEFAGVENVPAKVAEYATVTLSYLKGETDKAAYYEWILAHLGNAE